MIGIGILNYMNYMVTKECVTSILLHSPTEDYKIFILDNGSGNESLEELHKEYDTEEKVVVIPWRVNVGFARGNNILIKRFREEGIRDVVLSNSDIKFLDSSIDRMIKSLRDRKDAVVVGPKILTGGALYNTHPDLNSND